jgi:hypothetical protein
MTRGLITICVLVTAALGIGPASSVLTKFQAPRAGTSTKATADRASAEQSASRVPLPATQPSDPREIGPSPTDAVDRPRLTMAPRNAKLESRLRPLVPEHMTVREAAAGFGDQSQFVSAVHVSRNLGIPFESLKAKIIDERMTLGEAIRDLRPDANVWRELTRARDLMARDIY